MVVQLNTFSALVWTYSFVYHPVPSLFLMTSVLLTDELLTSTCAISTSYPSLIIIFPRYTYLVYGYFILLNLIFIYYYEKLQIYDIYTHTYLSRCLDYFLINDNILQLSYQYPYICSIIIFQSYNIIPT